MQFDTLFLVATTLLSAQKTLAHGIVSDLKVGNTWYKGSNPFQDPYVQGGVERIVWSFYDGGNGPVEDVSSDDIVCNKNAKAAALTAPVNAGDEVVLDWTTWPDSHKGPVMTYLADCGGNCSSATPSDLKWFKINDSGYDASSKTWASDTLIKNNNSWTVTIPSKLKSGSYLLRHEILALHSAGSTGGAQFYPMCANLEISGSGNAVPDETVSFPGAYKASDPGILVNIYNGLTSYTIPGPAVWSGAGGSSSSGSSSQATSAATSETASPTDAGSEASSTEAAAESTTTLSPKSSSSVSQTTLSTHAHETTSTAAVTSEASAETSAASSTGSSEGSQYTDYNSCMRAYNKCLDEHQPKSGGVADFSACSSFNCSN